LKFRSDFVTNSSSSSFIGVFAKIKDEEKANEIIQNYKLAEYIKTGKEILEQMQHKYFWGYGADWSGVDLTPNKKDIEENSKYIIWESYGGAGDGDYDFMEEDDYECNYDVDLSDFEKSEQEIYLAISGENGFSNINDGYGAGRNG
jgi:hypothetical protein